MTRRTATPYWPGSIYAWVAAFAGGAIALAASFVYQDEDNWAAAHPHSALSGQVKALAVLGGALGVGLMLLAVGVIAALNHLAYDRSARDRTPVV